MRYEYGYTWKVDGQRHWFRDLSKKDAIARAKELKQPGTLWRRPHLAMTADWNTWVIGAEPLFSLNLFEAEYTDTFGGEANYAWVQRWQFLLEEDARDRTIMREAKRQAGLTGAKGRTDGFGETQRFRPYGSCTVLFVNYVDQ